MSTTRSSEIPHSYFSAIGDVVEELLGPDHSCTKQFMKARNSSDPSDIDAAMEMVRTLPTAQRDHVFLTAKTDLRYDARVMAWLMKTAGSPTDIPPDRTTH